MNVIPFDAKKQENVAVDHPPDAAKQSENRHVPVNLAMVKDRKLKGELRRMMEYLLCHDLPDKANGGRRKGYVWPSRETISNDLEMTPGQASKLLRGLEERGYLFRVVLHGKETSLYFLTPPESWELELPKWDKSELSKMDKSELSKMYKSRVIQNGQVEKRTLKKRTEEEKRKNRGPSAPPPPSSACAIRKRHNEPLAGEQLETLALVIDVTSYYSKFPGVDVQRIYNEEFYPKIVYGKNGSAPNPYGARSLGDLEQQFERFLRTAAKDNPESGTDITPEPLEGKAWEALLAWFMEFRVESYEQKYNPLLEPHGEDVERLWCDRFDRAMTKGTKDARYPNPGGITTREELETLFRSFLDHQVESPGKPFMLQLRPPRRTVPSNRLPELD